VTGLQARLSARGATGELRALAAALCFLTRVPVGRLVELDGDDVARAGATFPLIGAGIGAAVGATAAALATPLSPLVAAVIALALGAALTGALHLDALADSADALGARSRERALEIMRDHQIGAYGAVALVIDLLLRAGLLAALAERKHIVVFATAAGALSRVSPVALATTLPYARRGGGAGASLTHGSLLRLLAGTAVALAFAVGLAGGDGAILAAAAAAVTLGLGLVYGRWLGGVTGDTLGAAVEVTELGVLVAALALVGAR
jgi:adenosylcobinamide-GDP ribazoletransferase